MDKFEPTFYVIVSAGHFHVEEEEEPIDAGEPRIMVYNSEEEALTEFTSIVTTAIQTRDQCRNVTLYGVLVNLGTLEGWLESGRSLADLARVDLALPGLMHDMGLGIGTWRERMEFHSGAVEAAAKTLAGFYTGEEEG